ncbi:MAG: alpha/beta hydrolase [Dermatophilaceae bacterium]
MSPLKSAMRLRDRPPRRAGESAGMEYVVVGTGGKSMLFLPGGPGSDIATGLMAALEERQLRPYLESGYAAWTTTRRRHMPPGHSIADMAHDHAEFIRAEMGGVADVVVGQSYGGLIALHLAADHPDVVGRVVIVGAAATLTEWGCDVDGRWARLRAAGQHGRAGSTMLEYLLPDERWAWLRRLAGPVAGAAFRRSATPADDLLVESEAEQHFDARDALSRISVPVLVICGDADLFFPPPLVQETVAGIADCTTRTYEGLGHLRTISSSRVPQDILGWLRDRSTG